MIVIVVRSGCEVLIFGKNARDWCLVFLLVLSMIFTTLELGSRIPVCRESIGIIDEKDEWL